MLNTIQESNANEEMSQNPENRSSMNSLQANSQAPAFEEIRIETSIDNVELQVTQPTRAPPKIVDFVRPQTPEEPAEDKKPPKVIPTVANTVPEAP